MRIGPLVDEIVTEPVTGSVIVVTSAFGSVPVLYVPPFQVTVVPALAIVWLAGGGPPAKLVAAKMSVASAETSMARPRRPGATVN
jgi:hypothetical protein